MGVKLKDLILRREIEFSELKGKILAVDAYNVLYQFLSSIRQMDGSYLTDSKGNVTSHLIGLFSRLTRLLTYGIKPVFVFDGTPSDLKKNVLDARRKIKERAQEKYELALREGNFEEAKKYSRQISKLTPEMANEARLLLDAMGVPYVDAPEEGEAQASYFASEGLVYACASQDYDALLFGSPRLVVNLTLSGRKKTKSKLSYEVVKPEVLDLDASLKELGLTLDQLIVIGILTGTDYAPSGVPGLGPKKALKLVRETEFDLDVISKKVEWDKHNPDITFEKIFSMFKVPNVDRELKMNFEFGQPNLDKLKSLLVEKHEFSLERVETTYNKLIELNKANSQKSLFDF